MNRLPLLVVMSFVSLAGCASLQKSWDNHNAELAQSPEQKERARLSAEVGHVEYVSFTSWKPTMADPITQPDDIQIFSSASKRDDLIELGRLSVQMNESPEYLTKLMRLRASLIGADGIMNFSLEQVPTEYRERGGVTVGNPPKRHRIVYQNKAVGVAVRFRPLSK